MLDRINILGLSDLIEQANKNQITEKDYQIKMAAELRRLLVLYYQGKLSFTIPDGPAVIALRKNFGSNTSFLKRIETSGQWLEDPELVVLAELFKSSLSVNLNLKGENYAMNLSPDNSIETARDVITLHNDNNVHWSAVVCEPEANTLKILPTLGDGNCAVNAIALILKDAVRKTDTLSLDASQQDRSSNSDSFRTYDEVIGELTLNSSRGDTKAKNILKQIDDDAKFAAQIALQEHSSLQNKVVSSAAFYRPDKPLIRLSMPRRFLY